jgi:enamine deaminase RidA (YjgF/YER057c/UK114 family)
MAKRVYEGTSDEHFSVPDDPAEQFTQAFENLGALLAEAGLTFADVVEMTSHHIGLHAHLPVFLTVKDSRPG